MTIDTEIRHVTKVGSNIFLELGFDAVEAEQFQAELQQHVNNTVALKEQLMKHFLQFKTLLRV